MTERRILVLSTMLAIVLLVLGAAAAHAQWVDGGAPVCTSAGDQYVPSIVSDGAGGAIVAWYDHRSGHWDIYVQRVDATGAALWTADGVAICTATLDQTYPTMVSDGAGGAIVTWIDDRNAINSDIYAQRVSASGVVQWTADGVVLCAAWGNQAQPFIVSDGGEGAIVAWNDGRYGSSNSDIYAQRIDASGAVQWTADGVALCSDTQHQTIPTMIPYGAGGAIVTWLDERSITSSDIYAQRIDASGSAQWAADGVPVCTATRRQEYSEIVSDHSGGFIVTWRDERNLNWDIYAQRLDASGSVQWTSDGVALCTKTGDQTDAKIVSDGSGGAIVSWRDNRGYWDIYAQRVDVSGVAQWTANGVAICAIGNVQRDARIVSDGAGGAVVAWRDKRSGAFDIYAQRVDASGAAQWTADGMALCTAAGVQDRPAIIIDGVGGAIVAWQDPRGADNDIYAQRVTHIGNFGNDPVPIPASAVLIIVLALGSLGAGWMWGKSRNSKVLAR